MVTKHRKLSTRKDNEQRSPLPSPQSPVPFFFVLCSLFFSLSPLFARDVTITVEDTELGLALEGAVIRSWDGRQYVCDADGSALVSVPDDRQVMIQGSYPGYESGRLVIVTDTDHYTLGLRLSGIMENRELVIEAARPGTSETVTGRSVAISGREIAQSAEIGIIEDVMNAVKLLPGVGYAGTFNAQPSIRGGHPGDMSAVLDGFYIFNPYHWGGGVSIFDPRMVQSAQLSHGVFSTRYGHTISGMLDITTKSPSPTETEFEIGVSTSAASVNLSFPLAGRGGVLFMGRITYYDPIIAMAKALSNVIENDQFEAVHSIRVAPYIRSGTVTGNYRFADNLELHTTGFWGMDGVGVTFINEPSRAGELTSSSRMVFDFTNYQGFLTTALNWNPRNDMLLKFSTGIGYEDAVIDGDMESSIRKKTFSKEFLEKYELDDIHLYLPDFGPSPYHVQEHIEQSEMLFNVQGRIDYDWELGNGFLAAVGIQEMFTRFRVRGDQQGFFTSRLSDLPEDKQNELLGEFGPFIHLLPPLFLEDLRVAFSVPESPDAGNNLFTTSGYGLVEYHTPNRRLGMELGLRVDHYYLLGKDFSLPTKPALGPRLNADFNIFKNRWILDSWDISAGTGLFSTMDKIVFLAEKRHNIKEIKPNRSWTSVLGTRLTFPEGLSFNIEGYYKYIYDRMYVPVNLNIDAPPEIRPRYDGEGKVWGIDLMLQKLQSRFWDGWLSYSFSHARYRNPSVGNANMVIGGSQDDKWHFPHFHRFHNVNLVFNVRPAPPFNIYTRFGLASGTQLARRIGDRPESYPVVMYDPNNHPATIDDIKLVERYHWPSVRDENNRVSPTLPMDVKFSIFGKNHTGKVRYEVYVAAENVLALVYRPQGNTRFNSYTGEVDTGSNAASYGMPIPIPSFGVKFTY
ncbi:MAG: TonB-dependent receptor plug domain-containing protein [Treponema sp.]|nr:TonB-dependent receptor plug domain-containing protein [Treponema sp.]